MNRALALLALAALLWLPAARADDEDKADHAKQLLEQGSELLSKKNWDGAVDAYKKAIDLARSHELDALIGEDGVAQVLQLAHFNSACALARKGDKPAALDHLEKALEAGYEVAYVERDKDLDAIRAEPRYRQLLEKRRESERRRLRQEAAKTVSDKALFEIDVDATNLAGEKVKLKDLRGKTVVIVYFGSWSPKSAAEIAALNRLLDEHKDVAVIGIAYELGKTDEAAAKELRKFVEQKGVRYPVILVGKDDPLLSKMPDQEGFPTKVFIDKEGRARATKVGYQSFDELEALLLAVEGGATPPPAEKKPEEKKREEKKPEKKPGEDEPI